MSLGHAGFIGAIRPVRARGVRIGLGSNAHDANHAHDARPDVQGQSLRRQRNRAAHYRADDSHRLQRRGNHRDTRRCWRELSHRAGVRHGPGGGQSGFVYHGEWNCCIRIHFAKCIPRSTARECGGKRRLAAQDAADGGAARRGSPASRQGAPARAVGLLPLIRASAAAEQNAQRNAERGVRAAGCGKRTRIPRRVELHGEYVQDHRRNALVRRRQHSPLHRYARTGQRLHDRRSSRPSARTSTRRSIPSTRRRSGRPSTSIRMDAPSC